MNNKKILLAAVVGTLATASLFAGASEEATLSATIMAGPLEIVTASVSGVHTPVGGDVTLTGSTQIDALTFNINGITINDHNGDEMGFQVTATPAVNLVNGASNLPIGTIDGFNNPSDVVNTTVDPEDASIFTFGLTSGVTGFTIDYDVSYSVPSTVAAGSYSGDILFAIIAQ